MSLLGMRAKNHPQQVGERGPDEATDDRGTDPHIFAALHERFAFTVDVAASPHNTKLPRFFAPFSYAPRHCMWDHPDECGVGGCAECPHGARDPRPCAVDGLMQPWDYERVWCNPPYSNLRPWLEKAWHEEGAGLVVMLAPANRCEQPWWQDLVEPFRDRAGSPLRTEFLRHRLRFIAPGAEKIGPNERPPFGCVLLIWERIRPHLSGLQASLDFPRPPSEQPEVKTPGSA